ncbi:MAG: MotA/TolQ/ExbB proton channel family protein [Myxococcaceae bacterium]
MDLLAIGLAIWAYLLSKRPGAPPWVRVVPFALALNLVVALAGTLWGLRHAFASVSDLPPESKAHALSEGIAHAMWWTAGGLGFDVVIAVTLVVASVRLRRVVSN